MYKAGRCITVGYADPARVRFESGRTTSQWAIKEYVAEPRKKDGKYTWRLVKSFGNQTGDKMPQSLVKEAKEYAEKRGYRFIPGITKGMEAELSELEKLSLA